MSLVRRAARRVPPGLVLRSARAGTRETTTEPNVTPIPGGLRGALAGRLQRLADRIGREPILDDLHLVHTIPKTGTYTLLEFVQRLGLRGEVRGTNHQLCLRRSAEVWDRDARPRGFLAATAWDRGRVNECWAVYRRLRSSAPSAGCAPPRRLHVISSTREPVGRRLSGAFFRSRKGPEPISVESALARLMEEPAQGGPMAGTRWWELDAWFDRNVKETLGIDVFAEPFDRERGWQIYEGEDARLLLVRQESFARLPEAASAFYGLPAPAAIPHANAGEHHAYRGSYREAREKMRVPAALLDTVYSARYARHFYSDTELQAFRRRWEER
ncbi:MAG TPA: putative capsular polysaccharide synthesis family protein [Longimicrobium sp.]